MGKRLTIHIFEDGAGGLTLQTYNYCHYYEDPKQLANDYYVLASWGETTKDWDGNDPSFRFTPYTNDAFGERTWNREEIVTAQLNEEADDIRCGTAFRQFIIHLKHSVSSSFI